ncbi:MAG: AraC family transcriptional regulator [Kofleriaceae bacterium]
MSAAPLSSNLVEEALGQSLRRLALGRAKSVYTELQRPWGMSFSSTGAAAGFHMVFQGSCWLASHDGPALRLREGDIALLPHGTGHAISDQPSTPTPPLDQQPARSRAASVDDALLCGQYKFSAGSHDPVLALLPRVVHVSAQQVARSPAFSSLMLALREEVRAASAGQAAVISSLVDAAFVFIVRCWMAHQDPVDPRWLEALRDPGLARCLARIHAEPAARWSLANLSELAGMSRAVFARRFAQVVGVSPLAYVTARRLDLAARLLRESEQSLGEIAQAVGYESEFAFSRAFKRSRELAPGRYRATHR